MPAQALRESVPSISPAVEQVVMRALAKDSGERFESVQAFAAALEQASLLDESNMPTMLAPPSPAIEQPLPPAPSEGSSEDTLPTLP